MNGACDGGKHCRLDFASKMLFTDQSGLVALNGLPVG